MASYCFRPHQTWTQPVAASRAALSLGLSLWLEEGERAQSWLWGWGSDCGWKREREPGADFEAGAQVGSWNWGTALKGDSLGGSCKNHQTGAHWLSSLLDRDVDQSRKGCRKRVSHPDRTRFEKLVSTIRFVHGCMVFDGSSSLCLRLSEFSV